MTSKEKIVKNSVINDPTVVHINPNLLEELKKADKDDKTCAKELKGIIALFTGADKIIQVEEYHYFNNIFNSNVTSEAFMNHMNKELQNTSVEKVDFH